MLHLLPDSQPRPAPYAEAVARLASIRHALNLVAPFGSGPAPDCDDAIAAEWDEASEARRNLFERRSRQLVGTTAAGVEALFAEVQDGRHPHQAASEALVAEIRRELADVAGIVVA